MLKTICIPFILAAGIASAPTPAAAQSMCGDRDKIVDRLKDKYSEQHRASGLQNSSMMVEVWTSAKTGTWTILLTQTNGTTCIAASGENWLEYEKGVLLGQAS